MGGSLILGIGAFGHDVVARLRSRVHARAVLLEHDPEAGAEALRDRVLAAAEGMLGLKDLLAAYEPGDDRRPSLDVVPIADITDPKVAECLPELVRELGQGLLTRFSHIFSGHDSANLTLTPVLALTGARQATAGEHAARCAERLEQDAASGALGGERGPRRKSGAAPVVPRIFVVEQQTSRYELSREELESTLVSFLALLMNSALRDQEPLRGFLRGPRQGGLFASFGCATLEMTLGRYCVLRGAQELVEMMRSAPAAAVAKASAAAADLVPSTEDIMAELSHPDSGDNLIELLRAQKPHIDFPSIAYSHTPEQIRDRSYGWPWFEALEGTVDALVRRLDDSEMDELSRVADERGLTLTRGLVGDGRAAWTKLEAAGPHGWAGALRLSEQVAAACQRQVSRLDSDLRAQVLPAFPSTDGVEGAFRNLRDEATRRPRPFRMWFFGVLVSLVSAVLLCHLPKWIVLALFRRSVPVLALSPSIGELRIEGPLHYVLDPAWCFFWTLLLSGAVTAFVLSRHRKQRHEALLLERDGLSASVDRFVADFTGPSVLGYYEARLRFALKSWALRALSRLSEAAERGSQRYTAIGSALSRLSRQFADEAQRAVAAATSADSGDLLYRTRADPDLLEATYEAVRPSADVAEQLFRTGLAEATGDDAPAYLLEARILETVTPHVTPEPAVLRDHAGPFVVSFVRDLHGKLGVPLETWGFDDRVAEHQYLFAPEWALEPLAEARAAMTSLPEALPHDDTDRVHLVAVRTGLTRDAIAVLAEQKP